MMTGKLLLLTLASYRLWKLVSEDTILDRPRAWLLGVPGWKPTGHETPPDGYREQLAIFLTCPWCAGFWICVLVWLNWLLWPHATVWIAVPLAMSAALGLIATRFG